MRKILFTFICISALALLNNYLFAGTTISNPDNINTAGVDKAANQFQDAIEKNGSHIAETSIALSTLVGCSSPSRVS